MSGDDKRLIEDYLPIQAISAESAREKRQISGLHLWWARRPLVACRAAIYGALVPAARFIPEANLEQPAQKPDTLTRRSEATAKGLGRAAVAQLIGRLCKQPVILPAVTEAKRHIFEAHAGRLSRECGTQVTPEDILAGRAPRPKVLDMFAGGGAIPLEALRLGCEAYALDLNPVAHIIQLCTLVYPQEYGRSDPTTRGCAENGGWAGLVEEVRHWGNWILQRVKKEIGDLYPLIPNPDLNTKRSPVDVGLWEDSTDRVSQGHLTPVAYLWTRTIICKNPTCQATVPLVRQTWLCKKNGRFLALRMMPSESERRVRFAVVESRDASGLGFDPEGGSKGGNATCVFCGTVADDEYVRRLGMLKQTGRQLMAIVCISADSRRKVYLSDPSIQHLVPDDPTINVRIAALCKRTGLTVPEERINPRRPSPWTRGASGVTRHGMMTWGDLFTPRQMLCLLTIAASVRDAVLEMRRQGYEDGRAKATGTYLAAILDKLSDYNSILCRWHYNNQQIGDTFGRQALPMVWDFAEANVFGGTSGSWRSMMDSALEVIPVCSEVGTLTANVSRGSAIALPWPNNSFDAVITDPPYYDNVPYADISDFFYVWLKRTVGFMYAEHFASETTPKKGEATALSSRHDGDMDLARREYEEIMAQSFREAHRVLKPGAPIVVVYAHKTTLGWATLVDALRTSGFTVTEAWPLSTEMKSRLLAIETASLASSIFLVARKREGEETGRYEDEVRPELETIVRERVSTLWALGISGADLVIACVGAGLRAFTRYAGVELANGEGVPTERFLTEVETAVLESILARLSDDAGGEGGRQNLAAVDSSTRFYTLWRFTYQAADLDAGEAIIFANGTHVELEGATGLAGGPRCLVEKKKGKFHLRDYRERGNDESLGLRDEDGKPAPIVDVLHRTLWLMENRPARLAEFLRDTQPNREQLRLVAQALAGPALKGGELSEVPSNAELSALAKLTANWRSLVEEAAMTLAERDELKSGQKHLELNLSGPRSARQAGRERPK